MSTNEKYPLGLPHAPNVVVDNHRLLHCIINGVIDVKQEDPNIDVYTGWYRMVQDFTRRKMTYDADRLPAIAGLARKFATAVDDRYHAGLWRKDLLIGLLWHPVTRTTGKKNSNSRAPSWSWASVDCSISYSSIISAGYDSRHIPMSPLLRVIDVADLPTCASYPFGTTSKASLQLFGALIPTYKNENEHADSEFSFSEQSINHTEDFGGWYTDDSDLHPSADTPWYCLPVCVQHDPYDRGIRSDPEPFRRSWKRSLETGVDEYSRDNRVFALILQAVKGKQDTFSRVGSCTIHPDKSVEISRKCFRERQGLTII
ncbi:hypothetical protein EK21DRAFT_106338 [Setomelanomma holmii]|uniref:Uncharacterized protein n=1 Tax=Setomelanomma holmii TaxID=210430 RepID=A0A9P4HMF5_9PLEO|nr:hypothetical protein EK21DRAFT_106338 [Setomelanomma holmii]